MTIIYERKEVHLYNPSLEELCQTVFDIRSDSTFDDFKILIDGTDENTNFKRKFQLS